MRKLRPRKINFSKVSLLINGRTLVFGANSDILPVVSTHRFIHPCSIPFIYLTTLLQGSDYRVTTGDYRAKTPKAISLVSLANSSSEAEFGSEVGKLFP